jgi:hypothetical protein
MSARTHTHDETLFSSTTYGVACDPSYKPVFCACKQLEAAREEAKKKSVEEAAKAAKLGLSLEQVGGGQTCNLQLALIQMCAQPGF